MSYHKEKPEHTSIHRSYTAKQATKYIIIIRPIIPKVSRPIMINKVNGG